MATSDIRDIIDLAVRHEQQTGALRLRLENTLPLLAKRLELPPEQPVEALMAFITSYIGSVPGCLNLVTAVGKQLGFYDYAAPFLHIAEDFFLAPPEELPEDGGLALLLDEAFLAHRLLEEINDHHIRHLGRTLLPLDMTEANIIVHHLLGETLANRLEQLVQYTTDRLLDKEHLWSKVRELPGSETAPLPGFESQSIGEPGNMIRLKLGGAR
jgi:hypothetical protein